MRKKTTKQVVSIAIVGLFSLVSSCNRKVDSASEARPGIIKSGHDEPIIIEQGSVKVDFSPKNSDTKVGKLAGDRRHFIRFSAGPIKFVRMWRKGTDTGGAFVERDCNGSRCTVDRETLRLKLTTNEFLTFLWTSEAYTPILMHSNGLYRFDETIGSEHRITSYDQNLKVSHVIFFDGKNLQTIDIRKNADDDVRVHLCAVDDKDHCPGPRS